MTLKKIFAELGLSWIFRWYLILRGIRSIVDLKKAIADRNPIIDTIVNKLKSEEKIELLKAYLRLDEISKNFELNKVLIENNFSTFHDITRIPFFDFQEGFRHKASENELKEIYYRAQQNLAKDITMSSLRTLTPQRSSLDYLVSKSESQPTRNIETENEEEETDGN